MAVDPRHVVAAVAEVLAERAKPETVSMWRDVVGRMSLGLGAGVVVCWQSIHGSTGGLLIHMAALALVWAGQCLYSPQD